MQRSMLVLTLMLLGGMVATTGCRSCGSCHDYSPPVADCECGCCGSGQRAGSAFGGYAQEGYVVEENVIGPVIAE